MSAGTEKETPSGPLTVGVCDVRTASSVAVSQRVRLFYPTVEDVTAPPAQFFPPSVGTWFMDRSVLSVLRFAQIPMASLFAWPLSYIASLPLPAQATGPVLPTEPKFPVMLFTHGLGGGIGNYSSFCIDMASYGWIVFAIEHADGSSFEALVHNNSNNDDNGGSHTAQAEQTQQQYSFIPYLRGDVNVPIAQFRAPQLDKRCNELTTLFNLLSGSKNKLNATDAFIPLRDSSPVPYNLFDRMDLTRSVVAGHSFGASTAIMYASRMETAPMALICMDAWLLPLKGRLDEFPIPKGTNVVFIDMADSNMTGSLKLRKHIRKQNKYDDATILDAIAVVDGLHNNASDFPLRIPHWIATLTKTTKPHTDPLRLLKAQSNAAYHFLHGPKSWAVFTDRVRNGREDCLQMGPM